MFPTGKGGAFITDKAWPPRSLGPITSREVEMGPRILQEDVLVGGAPEDDEEGTPAAVGVVAAVRRAEHRSSEVVVQVIGFRQAVLVAGDGVPHDEVNRIQGVEEHPAVAAVDGHPAGVVELGRGERGVGHGGGREEELVVEEAEDGGRTVVLAVAAEEAGFGKEEAPRPADEGCTD
nr:unnamed protein product [Digitaria exilis]